MTRVSKQTGQESDLSDELPNSDLSCEQVCLLLKKCDPTDLLIANEIPESGIEAVELSTKIGLTYSATSRRVLEMYAAGLLTRIKAVDSINPKSQPYMYFRAKSLSSELITEEAKRRQLDLAKLKAKLQFRAAQVSERQTLESQTRFLEDTQAEDINNSGDDTQPSQEQLVSLDEGEDDSSLHDQDVQVIILGRLIQEIRSIKEENASLKQEIVGLKDRLLELEKQSNRSTNNEAIMTMLNQLLSFNKTQNGKK